MPGQGNEAIIKFHRIGASVKGSATDTASLIEVSMVGPANARKVSSSR